MDNKDSQVDPHWLIKMAQDIRDGKPILLTSGSSSVDPDLSHPALSILGELIERCGYDIEPTYLMGYSYALRQVNLIDDVVLEAIGSSVGTGGDIDPVSDTVTRLN